VKLLYFAPVEEGGLAEYAVHQALALADAGIDLTVLGHHAMQERLSQRESIRFEAITTETSPGNVAGKGSRLCRVWSLIRRCQRNANHLADFAKSEQVSHILMSYFYEYFSPFWARPLRSLRTSGVRIGTIVHDPVRNFRLGPRSWHRYCISQAYSFIDVAFVHDETELDVGWPVRKVPICQIPHGLYTVPVPDRPASRSDLRHKFGIPDTAFVVLSFGHIRDGKNLDLLIQTLKSLPAVHLLVVGREQSSSQRPVSWYQRLAQQLGVHDRCHWVNRFVEDCQVEQFFRMSDLVALLYSGDFHSASGVLNNVAQFELPVLCSSGGGPLRALVEKYDLGLWVPPDNVDTIRLGIESAKRFIAVPNWVQYRIENSWQENARLVSAAMRVSPCR
jgi:glycosyltransferase involved in cell wall biosynthesis